MNFYNIIFLTIGIIILIILYRQNRIISATTIWILSYTAVFQLSPLNESVTNETQIAINSLVGMISFALGITLETVLTGNRVVRFGGESDTFAEFHKVYTANIIVYIMTSVVLIINMGFSGVISLVSGANTMSSVIKEGARLTNIYSILLRILMTTTVMVLLSANSKTERLKAYGFIIAYVAQVALFSFTRGSIIYIILITSMHISRNFSRKKKTIMFLVIGVVCIIYMIFGGYIRTFGVGEVDKFVDGIASNDDKQSLLYNNLDFSAAYVWYSRLLQAERFWVSPAVYLKTILMIVPRSMIPWKPETSTVQAMKVLSPTRAASGYSSGMSLLGEAYMIVGEIGYVIYPMIWGVLCKMYDDWYFNNIRCGDNVVIKYERYYFFATMMIIELHRGGFDVGFELYFWTVLIPLIAINKMLKK